MSLRRFAKFGAWVVLLLLVLTLGVPIGLLNSTAGRDMVLRYAVAALPAGSTLHWRAIEGSLAGPLTLRGVQFSMPLQRDVACVPTPQAPCATDTLTATAERLTLDVVLRQLLARTLRLQTLVIEGATLDLPHSETPFELPHWPQLLPALDLPLTVQVDAIRVDAFTIQQASVPQLRIQQVRGGVRLAPGALHIERLSINSDRGRFRVHGDYLPRANFRSALSATAVLPAPAGQAAPRLGVLLLGDRSTLLLAVGGRAPKPLRASLRLHANGDGQLRLHSEGLDPRLLAASGETSHALALTVQSDLHLAGTQWQASGEARIRRAQEQAQLRFDADASAAGAHFRKLEVTMPQGRLDASGALQWAPRLQWKADALLAGFDPGYFLPAWPGAIHGRVQSHGALRAGERGVLASINVEKLRGTLRGRSLSGQAQLDIDNTRYTGKLDLRLGKSHIKAQGSMADSIALDAELAPLQLADLLPDASGVLHGTLQLRGARAAPTIRADLQGSALAYDSYQAAHVQLRGRLPWQGGDGALHLDARGIQAGVEIQQLHATLQGAVSRLRLGLDAQSAFGTLSLQANAQQHGAQWRGMLQALHVNPTRGAAWALQAPAAWAWQGQRGTLAPACLQASAGGHVCASADWPRQGVQLQGEQLPLAMLAGYLPQQDGERVWQLHGETALRAQLKPARRGWEGALTLTSANGGARYRTGAQLDMLRYRDLQFDAQFDPRRISADLRSVVDADGTLEAHLDTGWDANAALNGSLKLATDDLLWLELFSPDLVSPSGRLRADVQIAGTRTQPRLAGRAQLQAFAAELPALGISPHDGELRLDARPDGSATIQGRLHSGAGVLTVDGQLDWQHDDTPLLLTIRGNDVLLADTRQLRAVVAPELTLRHRLGHPLQLAGRVTIQQADLHLERLEMAVTPSTDVVVLDPPDPQRMGTDAVLGLDMDLTLVMGDAVKIDGYGLQGILGGSLRMRAQPAQELRASGVLLIDGRYRAYGQDLNVSAGKLAWANTAIDDPILDLRAERSVGEVVAGIHVEGRASAPEVKVYSNPAMSQSEALAYLTLGRPLPSLSSKEMQQVNVAQSALNAGTGLLAAKLGAKLGLDDAGVSESRALGGSVLRVGKYLSPKLYVSYGVSMLGTGQVMMLKYLLRKGFEIQIETSTLENRASLNWRREK